MKKSVKIADQKTDLKRVIDHIGVTVNFLIHDGNGKILLQKRSINRRDEHGRWDIGGGAVEFGETLEQALERELLEEYKVKPIEYEQTDIYTALRDNNGTLTHWLAINFKVLVDPSHIQIGEPHKVDGIGWFGKDNLPSLLHSMFDQSYKIAVKHNLLQ